MVCGGCESADMVRKTGKDGKNKMKKYELTEETVTVSGKTLHRIKAVRDFGSVKAGEFGGYIEKEENLSHFG